MYITRFYGDARSDCLLNYRKGEKKNQFVSTGTIEAVVPRNWGRGERYLG